MRDEDLLKHWDSSLHDLFCNKFEGLFPVHLHTELSFLESLEKWCHFANWLDILWFAHHTKKLELQKIAAENLKTLINVENVVGIITAAHASGEKEVNCISQI